MIQTEEKDLPTHTHSISKKQLIIKSSLLSLPIVIVMLLITAIIFANYKFNDFVNHAQISKPEFKQTITEGWQLTPMTTQDRKNFLILGLDALETRGESMPLADSLMLVSLNLKSGKITTLPLPRDLWSEEYKTRINALYTYGLDRYPDQPENFPQEVIAEMIGLPIHHTIIISMENVSQLIDLAGGVTIDVNQGFMDKEFPRTDVDVTTQTDPEKLYETIEFKAGEQTMDGQTALKYMRSRHGDNDQNTDDSRSLRQQVVIRSLATKLINKDLLLDTKRIGQLYRYYLDNFTQQFAITEAIATAKAIFPLRNQIELNNASLSIYPADPLGTIEHPPQYLYDGQWIYLIKDEAEFKSNIQNQLTR